MFTNTLTQEIICELKIEGSNLLAIACVWRSLNTAVDNLGNLNVLLKNIYGKYDVNLIVLGDVNYFKIDWAYYSKVLNINYSNYKFLETTRDCFFQQYVKSSTEGTNSDHPSLRDL